MHKCVYVHLSGSTNVTPSQLPSSHRLGPNSAQCSGQYRGSCVCGKCACSQYQVSAVCVCMCAWMFAWMFESCVYIACMCVYCTYTYCMLPYVHLFFTITPPPPPLPSFFSLSPSLQDIRLGTTSSYFGSACECDNSRCETSNGQLCGGSAQGICRCEGCQCVNGFYGNACQCSNALCVDPTDTNSVRHC